MSSDRNNVLAAVQQNGYALQDAPEELKNDREIVLAAVQQNGAALEYASDELRRDVEIVKAAEDARKLAEANPETGKEKLEGKPVSRKVMRSQKVIGDVDQGKDELGVATIANALAETLVFKDLNPPFVLGTLGQWGRGKSFFFNLMLDHMSKIQKKPANDAFAGHIYVVKFDAWTFSKGDLWSSIMYQILKTLNEQLQFEEELIDKVEEGKNGDRASDSLLNAIDANYGKDRKEIKELRQQIDEDEQKLESRVKKEKKIYERQMFAKQTELFAKQTKTLIKNMGMSLNSIGQRAFQDSANQALTKMLQGIEEGKGEEDNNQDDNEGDNHDGSEDSEQVFEVSTEDVVREIKKCISWYSKIRASNIPPFAIVASVAIIIVGTFIFLRLEETIPQFVSGSLSALFSIGLPLIKSASTTMEQINPYLQKIEELEVPDIDLELGSFDPDIMMKDFCEQKEKIEAKRMEMQKLENRTLALKGSSLRDTIAKNIDRKKYEDNLGIVHKVHQDLQQISDAMLKKRDDPDDKKIFPRGIPRIILFVDDLDRCEHSVVVKVIEALQLLVKTKLFVAVLAIDPRYVCRSLEKHYQDILDPHTPPSGMDFLEKIVQIPFRLPACVDYKYVPNFVKSQIAKEPKNEKKHEPKTTPKEKGKDVVSGPQEAAKDQEPRDGDEDFSRVYLTDEEEKMIVDIMQLVTVGPRCMKRIINVYKVLMVVWNKNAKEFPANQDLKAATLFIMVLASKESTREVTHTIYEWMEAGVTKYHHVMLEKDKDKLCLRDRNNLANLFRTELRNQDKSFEFETNGTEKQGTLLFYIEIYFRSYSWTDADEWSAVCSDFLLARSFSFFRLASEEVDPTSVRTPSITQP